MDIVPRPVRYPSNVILILLLKLKLLSLSPLGSGRILNTILMPVLRLQSDSNPDPSVFKNDFEPKYIHDNISAVQGTNFRDLLDSIPQIVRGNLGYLRLYDLIKLR
jgi:hypothetical protein